MVRRRKTLKQLRNEAKQQLIRDKHSMQKALRIKHDSLAVRCPFCKGKGAIQYGKDYKPHLPNTQPPCKHCKGTGYVIRLV